MVRKLVLSLIAILGAGALFVGAQNRQISGTVTNPEGQPIVGATVVVDGTSAGTTTGSNGKFTVTAPADATLTVSFLGYETQSVPVGGKTWLDIELKEDSQSIDDVIVVAYGTASKASLTGSVAAVKAADIEKRTTTSVTGVIEGAAPGIQVNNTYGEPGHDPEIRIRGFGSVNGTNKPLYVVNGMVYNGNISDLNSADIESISVLKDAASAALYGNRAANGVVVITTKKGRSEKVSVTASTTHGIYNRGIAEYERLKAGPWMETMWTGFKNYAMTSKMGLAEDAARQYASSNLIAAVVKRNIYDAADNALFDANGKLVAKQLGGYTDLDWNDEVERLGYRQEYNLSADAAGEKWDVYSSFSYLSEKGYIVSSDFSRFTGRLAANFKPVKWFKTGLDLSGSSSKQHYLDNAEGQYSANPFYAARMMAPVYPVYLHNADGSFLLDENGSKQYDTSSSYLGNRNIAYELRNDEDLIRRMTLNGQIYGTVTFLKDFQFTVRGDMNLRNNNERVFNNPNIGDGASNNGRTTKYYSRYLNYTFQQQLTWNHDFGLHHVDALLAHENFSYEFETDYILKSGQKLSGDNHELSNFSELVYGEGASTAYKTESYLARARYNYDNRYFVEGSFRRDGSSRFHPDHRWGNFWSVGASWMISGEKFMQNASWVDNLKLRASYGEVGNDAGVGYYAYMALYAQNMNGGMGTLFKSQNLAKEIKWETSASFDVGIDARLFNRWNLTLDYFDKRSRDLLFNVYLPLSAGATDIYNHADGTSATGMASITKNIGSVSNYGFEIATDVDVINRRDWHWNIGLNATFLKNKIKKLPDGKDISLGALRTYSEGHGIYDFKTYKFVGVDQMTGNSLYRIDFGSYYVDGEADGRKPIPADKYVQIGDSYYTTDTTYGVRDWSGSAIPDVYGSISTSLSWKNLTLSVLCTYSLGGKVYDSTYASLMSMSANNASALHKDMLKSWSGVPQGMTADSPDRIDPNGIPVADMNLSTDNNAASDRWLQDASYFVIKNISLSYNFPKTITRKMGIDGLSVNVGIENAATFTSLKGMNPQYSFTGAMDNTYVTARIFSLGLSIKL
ncbi:TonB-dependent receptor [uncultured Alistipes sp.]|uniref:SusC/RagA family TonB-linked outer membrane protein n=1 Tax=uncultured Alistipes sp. TaxID=538949 RepID=UPI0032201159